MDTDQALADMIPGHLFAGGVTAGLTIDTSDPVRRFLRAFLPLDLDTANLAP